MQICRDSVGLKLLLQKDTVTAARVCNCSITAVNAVVAVEAYAKCSTKETREGREAWNAGRRRSTKCRKQNNGLA